MELFSAVFLSPKEVEVKSTSGVFICTSRDRSTSNEGTILDMNTGSRVGAAKRTLDS